MYWFCIVACLKGLNKVKKWLSNDKMYGVDFQDKTYKESLYSTTALYWVDLKRHHRTKKGHLVQGSLLCRVSVKSKTKWYSL